MMKYAKMLLVLLVLLLTVTACASQREIRPINKDLSERTSFWTPDDDLEIRKLVFSIPDMDRKMCETFPKLIIENLESEKGVLDASFSFEGHIVTVIYAPVTITKEELLSYGTYDWIGVVFISDESIDDDPLIIYTDRLSNNEFEMPDDHMLEDDS